MTYTCIIDIPEINITVLLNHIIYITKVAENYDDFAKGEHEDYCKPDKIGYYKIMLSDKSFIRVNNKLLPREKLIKEIAHTKTYHP